MTNLLNRALEGVTVLDLSRILAGPWCTQNLADLGATVYKVEHPVNGDDTRKWGPPYLDSADGEDRMSAYFISCNRNKRSIALDFSTEAGRRQLRRLAGEADILVENYKVGTLKKYGLDYASLKTENPRLIYLSITGYGQTGPMSDKPGYDYVFQGMGGLMSYTGHPDGMPGAGPLRAGVAVIDLSTGMYATSAILAALYQRQQTGEGAYIDIALLDVAVAMNANQGANYLVSGQNPPRSGNFHPNCAPYEVFQCADNYLILAIGNDEQFQRFCEATGMADVARDSRYARNSDRIDNLSELRKRLQPLFLKKTKQDWGALLDRAAVPWGSINSLSEVFAHPQVQHRGMLQYAEHPRLGRIPLVRNPMLTGAAPGAAPVAPPLLGEGQLDLFACEEGTRHE